MPDSCCVVGCSNRRSSGENSLQFFNIPAGKTTFELRRRQAWLKAIHRPDLVAGKPRKAKICGAHFITGW